MGVKLEKEKYIKNRLKAKYGELEVYNPIENDVYNKLIQIIRDNSVQISENGISDIQINNTVKIFRIMLMDLTNIESEEYWNSINDIDLEKMLNLADGDFKQIVNTLMDILIELGRDIRTDDMRKLNILNDKLLEMSEAIKANMELDKTLSSFGLDRDKLIKLQQGDEETVKEFQKNLLEQQINKTKSKRGRPKTKK